MSKPLQETMWAFAWKAGDPYITSIINWSKRGLIMECEKYQGIPWKKIYGRGGRAIKVIVKEQP